MPHKITRDALLFLTPKSKGEEEEFAQCGPCRMFVPEEYLQGKMRGHRCIAHGSRQEIDDDDSCGFYLPWPTPDGKPVEKVVEDHAAELLKIIPGSVTATDSGLVSRRVQCHRCTFSNAAATRCGLYEQLNKEMPDVFDLNPEITPHSCCNAQEEKSNMSDDQGSKFKSRAQSIAVMLSDKTKAKQTSAEYQPLAQALAKRKKKAAY